MGGVFTGQHISKTPASARQPETSLAVSTHTARPRWVAAWARVDARPPWSESSSGPATVQDTDRTYGVLV